MCPHVPTVGSPLGGKFVCFFFFFFALVILRRPSQEHGRGQRSNSFPVRGLVLLTQQRCLEFETEPDYSL